MTHAVVLDIEGTVSPAGAVKDTLFAYTAEHLPAWLWAGSSAAHDVCAETAVAIGRPSMTPDEALPVLLDWIARDVKAAPLKKAQGILCHAGFERGDLVGVFYPDVRPALESWRANGTPVHTYSSGSAQNQRDWFRHAEGGSMSHLVDQCFDLVSSGPKDDAGSYRRIARDLGHPPERILFLTDAETELSAACTAGWAAVAVHRPDTAPATPCGLALPVVSSLLDVDVFTATRVVRS